MALYSSIKPGHPIFQKLSLTYHTIRPMALYSSIRPGEVLITNRAPRCYRRGKTVEPGSLEQDGSWHRAEKIDLSLKIESQT
jgi:hypothetical protein